MGYLLSNVVLFLYVFQSSPTTHGTLISSCKVEQIIFVAHAASHAITIAHSASHVASADESLFTCVQETLLQLSLQAGAGLVADSVPEAEYEETVNKAAALGRAIDLAEQAFVY